MKLSVEELMELWGTFNNTNKETTVTKKSVIINKKYRTTLVVGDAHTAPGQDLKRFTALGRYANEVRSDEIIFMGDFANFDSLSSYDAGKESSHGKIYKEEIKTARTALILFKDQLEDDYTPSLIFLAGNHDENRIEKYIETHPLLRGHLDLAEDMRLDELGFKYVPYRQMYCDKNGVLYTHAVMNAANQPVSGKNILHTIAALTAKSIVVGHHHRFEALSYFRHGSDDTQHVVLSGVFSEHTDSYAQGGNNAYSRCILLLTHEPGKPGKFDICQTSIARLKYQYL